MNGRTKLRVYLTGLLIMDDFFAFVAANIYVVYTSMTWASSPGGARFD